MGDQPTSLVKSVAELGLSNTTTVRPDPTPSPTAAQNARVQEFNARLYSSARAPEAGTIRAQFLAKAAAVQAQQAVVGLPNTATVCPTPMPTPAPTQNAARVQEIQTVVAQIHSAEATSLQAQQQVTSVIENMQTQHAHSHQLARSLETCAQGTATFCDSNERFILGYITSLAGWGRRTAAVQRFLEHFDKTLRSITRDVLDTTTVDDRDVLRVITETCYIQALDHTSGILHANNYVLALDVESGRGEPPDDPDFVGSEEYDLVLGESGFEWPSDPDSGSEEYYEHETGMGIGETDAEMVAWENCERKSKEEETESREWVGFWFQALKECPDGPTLFEQPKTVHEDVPRYLFRVFDCESSGRSDHHVVASMESISETTPENSSRVDIFSRPEGEATQMLYRHLNNLSFGGEHTDNLMSWSSSLLFMITFAKWRCSQRCRDPSEVQICMVDTTKFPPGQFARDMSLIQAYCNTSESSEQLEIQRFFGERLVATWNDNGEYLSQGILHHAGRSSVTSLAQLTLDGLHVLYPEFADSFESSHWTARVMQLRSTWGFEYTTIKLDIKRALGIARACFNRFDESNVAMLLLLFKNRKVWSQTGTENLGRIDTKVRSPHEVQRYMAVAETASRILDGHIYDSRWLSSPYAWLSEQIFECS